MRTSSISVRENICMYALKFAVGIKIGVDLRYGSSGWSKEIKVNGHFFNPLHSTLQIKLATEGHSPGRAYVISETHPDRDKRRNGRFGNTRENKWQASSGAGRPFRAALTESPRAGIKARRTIICSSACCPTDYPSPREWCSAHPALTHFAGRGRDDECVDSGRDVESLHVCCVAADDR